MAAMLLTALALAQTRASVVITVELEQSNVTAFDQLAMFRNNVDMHYDMNNTMVGTDAQIQTFDERAHTPTTYLVNTRWFATPGSLKTQAELNMMAEALLNDARNAHSGLRMAYPYIKDADVDCKYRRDWYMYEKQGRNPLKSMSTDDTFFARRRCDIFDDYIGSDGYQAGMALGILVTLIIFGGLVGAIMMG